MSRRTKKVLVGAAVLALGGWLLGTGLMRSWTAKPPPLPTDASILQRQPQARDGRTWLGESWMTRREGLLVVRLKGSPFEMGYASSALMPEQMHTLEREFLAMIQGYVPQKWKLQLLKSYVIYRNRRLSQYVSDDFRSQIHGVVLGCPDIHPELGDYYNRMLNYHAAHDISYMMIEIGRASCRERV